jgi:hypothetical protein
MNKTMKILFAAALAVTTSGAALASQICAYVNDNSAANSTEGYMIGPGIASTHVGPYSTNGIGGAGPYTASNLAATREAEGDLYIENVGSNNITHFIVNKTNCALTLDPTLYASGDIGSSEGVSLAITLDGQTMFDGSVNEDHIYSHTIAADGSLGAPFTESSSLSWSIDGMEVSPDGKTLVVS